MNTSSLLTEIQTFDTTREAQGNLTWNIPPDVGEFLRQTIIEREAQTVLEIGTSTGYSALWLALGLLDTNGHLHTIESHQERHDIAKERFTRLDLTSTITLHKGHAPEILADIPGIFDLCFFDATKKDHIRYFTALESRLSPKGMIIADNVLSHRSVMQPYLDHVMNNERCTSHIIDMGSGLCISDFRPSK